MKTTGGTDAAKRRAGETAAEQVEDGMVVGLGTGSTAAHAIRAIGHEVDAGLDVRGVPTSFASRQLARECGIPLLEPDGAIGFAGGVIGAGDGATDSVGGATGSADEGEDPTDAPGIHLAIDGADQVTTAETTASLIKGGGAAHAREKVVAAAADRFVVVVDPSKEAEQLDRSVPVEVLPDAHTAVAAAVQDAGGVPELRAAERKDGPVVTDNGNLVLDCEFGPIAEPATLATELSGVPGVVEHGIFVDLADEVHVGTDDGVRVWSR